MILLDTNICMHIINARPAAVLERFRQYRMGEIGVSSVVAAELAYGVVKSGSSRNRLAMEMFLAPLIILPFDEAVIWAYGELRAELERRGTPIGSLDTMIAAHAIRQQAPLVTNNTREFVRVPGPRPRTSISLRGWLCLLELTRMGSIRWLAGHQAPQAADPRSPPRPAPPPGPAPHPSHRTDPPEPHRHPDSGSRWSSAAGV